MYHNGMASTRDLLIRVQPQGTTAFSDITAWATSYQSVKRIFYNSFLPFIIITINQGTQPVTQVPHPMQASLSTEGFQFICSLDIPRHGLRNFGSGKLFCSSI